MKTFLSLLAVIMVTQISVPVFAVSKDEMVKFVDEAKDYVKKNGKDKAFAAFSDAKNTQFQKGELYMFAYDYDGKCIQHGKKPELVNKPAMELQDKKGKFLVKEMAEQAKTKKSGFVEYYWPNPANNNQVEKKLGYVVDVDGQYFVGSGIYLGK